MRDLWLRWRPAGQGLDTTTGEVPVTDFRQLEMDLQATRIGLQRMREERDQWRSAYLKLNARVTALASVWVVEDDLLQRKTEERA